MAHASTAGAASQPPRETSTDAVYQQIRARILSNEFRPGTQLLEQELVALFGVSRTPVREALIRLQKENLLVIVPRHGMRVRSISIADIEEVQQVQASLEATAAEAVARAAPKAKDLKPLDKACTEMERAFERDDLAAWAAAADAFYAHLLTLAGNPRLTQIVGECRAQMGHVRDMTLRLVDWPDAQTDALRAIVAAARAGDAATAGSVARAHRTRIVQWQVDALRRHRIFDV
ncbi:GntR family transcriptional regulator [Burkholderia sp. SRS-W-2-2016]|uniref:GntR family transcriptional regulator n=1 Tax=Burkholderia sp. SRS-W-2-2016 TaxID=1926878 RepID=UPI00094AD035|nr:GntR family transcriptional regulator [Burkholderia sp. SRS-W-2-2016]OLL29228.1 GntR family transcriptional regulator [Burkholderia sp. SRS-W-2-2016]